VVNIKKLVNSCVHKLTVKMSPMADPFYFGIIGLARTLFTLEGLCFRVTGTENVPAKGGAVVVMNHTGYLDFAYAGIPFRSCRRYVRYMAKSEVFDHPIAGPIMRGMKHIPVDRIDGSESYRQAVDYLRSGRLVGVFPESTISRSFEIKDFRKGAVRMAQEAGVPLIPVTIVGSQRVWTKGHPKRVGRTRTPIYINVLSPIHPDGDAATETDRLRDVMVNDLDRLWEMYLQDNGPIKGDEYWIPARYGGAAPPFEVAQREDNAVAEERHGIRKLRDDLNNLTHVVTTTTRDIVNKSVSMSSDAWAKSSDAVKSASVSARDSVTESAAALNEKMPWQADEETKLRKRADKLEKNKRKEEIKEAKTAEKEAEKAEQAEKAKAEKALKKKENDKRDDGAEKIVESLQTSFDSLYEETSKNNHEGASKIIEARDSFYRSSRELLQSVQSATASMTDATRDIEWMSLDKTLTSLIGQTKQIRDKIPARIKSKLPSDVAAVCSDIDGTILHENTISDATCDVFEQLNAHGVEVLLATGRAIEEVDPVVEQLPISPIAICANGAVVYDTKDKRVLHVEGFFEGGADILTHQIEEDIPDAQIIVRTVDNTAVKVVVKADMPSEDIADALDDSVRERSTLTYSNPYGSIELGPIGVNKSTGAEWYFHNKGIDPSHVIAFGDMPNDTELLSYVGAGITMGNADRDLIRDASWVTSSVEDDGVAEVLKYVVKRFEDQDADVHDADSADQADSPSPTAEK